MPRIKQECPENNEEKGDMIQLDTLEAAEALAMAHKEGPKPVFFLEPGDLILHTLWSACGPEVVTMDCIFEKEERMKKRDN